MARLKVYLYDYFDRQLKCDRRSTQFATADAIATEGGTVIAESERLVEEDLLDANGTIASRNLPPREMPPARNRPDAGDVRV